MIPQPPPGYIPAGHHGGAKNAQGQWWYPSKAHAYAHAAAVDNAALLHNPNRGGDAVTYQQMQAESEALYAHGHAMPNESHAERHALYDAHVNGPLTAATQRFATATANAAAAAAGVEAAHEHADSELEDAGRYLQEQQDTANELAPYEDMELDTHNEWGIASQEPDHHLGADHPEVHAARAFHAAAVSHAEPQEDDDPDHAEALAAYHAHVHGPLAEATKRYAEARAKHAAAMSQASAQAAAARAEWVDAAAYLAAQQAVAGNLVSGWPESATGGEDLTEDVADGRKQDHEDPDTDEVDAAQRFLTRAKTLQATAHAATHAQGINMDEAERRDEDDGEEIPMSKSMRAFRAEWAAFRDLFKGVKKGTKKKDNPEWERVGRTYRKKRSATDTHTVGRGGYREAQTLHRDNDYAADQDEYGFHVTHLPTRRHVATVDTLSAAKQLMRDIRGKSPDHPFAAREAEWATTFARGRVAKRQKLEAANAAYRKEREQAKAAMTATAKERRQQDRDRRMARYRGHGYEPGREHPLSRREPSAAPSELAQHIHGVLQTYPDEEFHPEWLQQHAARAANREVSIDDVQAALGELGNKTRVRMTRAGHPGVKLRKAGSSVDLFRAEVEAFRALMGV